MLISFLFSSLLFAEDGDGKFEFPTAKVSEKGVTTSSKYPDRPLRPTTHPKDPALSSGTIVNFQRLYINPEQLQIAPNPSTEKDGKQDLPVVNRTTAWVDIEISGQKIGRIGPLTTGLIKGVRAGEYNVTYTVEHMQYAYTERTPTYSNANPITPGNTAADIANLPGFKKPGFDDNAPTTGGKLAFYNLPRSTMLESDDSEELQEEQK
ncbi:MAG: hypothetical protein VX278_12250 [Myxococcota bacterium]|nr:hypothetical protein [Myxococcota bacterium]